MFISNLYYNLKVDSKAQASLEYMVMLAISLTIFTAIIYVTGVLISTSSLQVGVDASHRAVEKLRSAADFIYVHGHPSRTEVSVYIPPNIESLNVTNTNNSIVARVSVGETYTDIYGVTKGDIHGYGLEDVRAEGYYVFKVESFNDEDINITVI
jgi:uncharacterized protein (UPF0333 family)